MENKFVQGSLWVGVVRGGGGEGVGRILALFIFHLEINVIFSFENEFMQDW